MKYNSAYALCHCKLLNLVSPPVHIIKSGSFDSGI